MKGWVSHLLTAIVFTLVGAFLASLVFGLRSPTANRAAEEVPRQRIRVEVLNAAGIDGLARRATDSLRAAGFDVVYYGNAPTFDREWSVVLDRVGDRERALAAAAALGIPNVRSELERDLYLDVTVLLGRYWAAGTPQLPTLTAPPRADGPAAPATPSADSSFWKWLRGRIARLLEPSR